MRELFFIKTGAGGKTSKTFTIFFVFWMMLSMATICIGAEGLMTDNVIIVDDTPRFYTYYVPGNPGPSPRPLVILLHGGGGEAAQLTGEKQLVSPYRVWINIAERNNLFLALPEGTENDTGSQVWNDCRADATSNSGADDVRFIELLIDHLSHLYPIDTNRIYASGSSNGGHMAIRLAIELSNKIAAVAPVSAGMPGDSGCGPATYPTSILFMNGTDDPIMPYEGGEVGGAFSGHGTALSVEESVRFWVNFNNTDPVPFVSHFPDINRRDGSRVIKILYPNGIEGTQVALYKISGGGHGEPSIREQYSHFFELWVMGRQNHDIEMAEIVWKFFKDKTL